MDHDDFFHLQVGLLSQAYEEAKGEKSEVPNGAIGSRGSRPHLSFLMPHGPSNASLKLPSQSTPSGTNAKIGTCASLPHLRPPETAEKRAT